MTQNIAVQFKDFLVSEILNMPFLGYGFLKISKPQNPQNINKFEYLMNVWVIISTNIQSDYIQVIDGGDCSTETHTNNRQNNWKYTYRDSQKVKLTSYV